MWRVVEKVVDTFRLQSLHTEAQIVRRQDLRFALDTRCGIDRWIYYLGTYERADTRLMLRMLRPGWVVLDVGANIGWYTLMAAKALAGTGAVHAFEPAPEEFARLSRNLALNGFPNVTLHEQALSDSAGQGLLTELRDAGMTRLATATDSSSRPVSVSTLDLFIRANTLGRLDFVKVDIEGAELRFLQGGRSTLARLRPALMMELHAENLAAFGTSPKFLVGELEQMEYRLYRTTRKGLDAFTAPPHGTSLMNVIALPGELAEARHLPWPVLQDIAARHDGDVRAS
jgi:FkbM family methyltransferase